jgi:hypothetical protein
LDPEQKRRSQRLLDALSEDNLAFNLCDSGLGNIRSCKDERVLLRLFKALRSTDRMIPGVAVESLLAIGKDTDKLIAGSRCPETTPPRAEDKDVRPGILASLLDTGSVAKSVLPDVIEMLEEDPKEHDDLHWQALRFIKSLGSDGKEAIPALRKLLKSRPIYEDLILSALEGIDPDAK